MEAVFAPVEARYRAQVEAQTWGHLAPTPRQKYPGTIVFAHGEYGDIAPVKVDFPGLPDSPWFFGGMNEFIGSRATVEGNVYLFSGTYMMRKNGTHAFSGKVRAIRLPV